MPHTVLIVQDNLTVLARMAEAFAKAGFHVTATASFSEAASRIRFVLPDLLLTARRLHRFNGLHLVINARRMSSHVAAIVTDCEHDEGAARDVAAEGALYVASQADPDSLVSHARQLLDATPPRPSTLARPLAPLPAAIGDIEVQVLDMSYSGLRVEVASGDEHRLMKSRTLNAGELTIPIQVVWARRRVSASDWWCGMEVATSDAAVTSRWRAFVDATH